MTAEGEAEYYPLANIRWLNGSDGEPLKFNRPDSHLALGKRNSGKSVTIEAIAEWYLANGHGIIDLFGGRGAEGFGWLRSRWVEKEGKTVLLLRGENVEVTSKAGWTTKVASHLTLEDFQDYDLILNASLLYSGLDDEFTNAGVLMNCLYRRAYWKRLNYLVCREASSLFYSRMKVAESQTAARSQGTYLIRQARQVGLGLGMDSIRWSSLEVDLRTMSTILFLKALGGMRLNDDLKWIFRYVEPLALNRLAQKYAIILTESGKLAFVQVRYPSWHKQEGEAMLQSLGIDVVYKENVSEPAKDLGSHLTVSDQEHSEIISLYVEEGKGMETVAKEKGRSSATILGQIHRHDDMVNLSGYCSMCERVGSPYSKDIAQRTAAAPVAASHQATDQTVEVSH